MSKAQAGANAKQSNNQAETKPASRRCQGVKREKRTPDNSSKSAGKRLPESIDDYRCCVDRSLTENCWQMGVNEYDKMCNMIIGPYNMTTSAQYATTNASVATVNTSGGV